MTVIHSIGVEKTPSGAHFIIIAQTGPAAKNCLRVTQHVIYRDYPAPEGGTIRQYVPLGMALNGLGFSNISETVVMLEAPSGTPAGSWDYVNRSVYFCSIPPGLTKITQSTSAPRSVELK